MPRRNYFPFSVVERRITVSQATWQKRRQQHGGTVENLKEEMRMAADRSSNGSVPAAGISRLRELLSNPLSLVGLALAAVALVNILSLFLIDLMSDRPSPYIGILASLVAPAFLFLGLWLWR